MVWFSCCSSRTDYELVPPSRLANRPANQWPHNPAAHRSQGRRHPQGRPQPRSRVPSREELEKQRRQAQATAAARTYGWPTTRRGTDGGGEVGGAGSSGSRDSVIEPHLAGGLAALPGSDFRAVYDPRRAQHPSPAPPPPPPPPPQQQQQVRLPNYPRQQPQHPPYHPGQSAWQQPGRMPATWATPTQGAAAITTTTTAAAAAAPVAYQRPTVARRPVVRTAPRLPSQPQRPRHVRRDSNGVSECSSDEGDGGGDHNVEDYRHLRNYTVSPLQDHGGGSGGGPYTQAR
ncbi:hypothetical protein SAMD00023353_0302290 [Rosellinia necatrix]|uniref:Uncharacterized protein n=1 Tax=Rosellinia necatrix TaxID=77044 RepID=A0A1W2TDM5_ROSNE|nr:hypothetical protein SAMD00023353_0302290 [Rosellinia necatrix]